MAAPNTSTRMLLDQKGGRVRKDTTLAFLEHARQSVRQLRLQMPIYTPRDALCVLSTRAPGALLDACSMRSGIVRLPFYEDIAERIVVHNEAVCERKPQLRLCGVVCLLCVVGVRDGAPANIIGEAVCAAIAHYSRGSIPIHRNACLRLSRIPVRRAASYERIRCCTLCMLNMWKHATPLKCHPLISPLGVDCAIIGVRRAGGNDHFYHTRCLMEHVWNSIHTHGKMLDASNTPLEEKDLFFPR